MASLVAEEHFELFWVEGGCQFRLKYLNVLKIETISIETPKADFLL